jgi:hypothetical protein
MGCQFDRQCAHLTVMPDGRTFFCQLKCEGVSEELLASATQACHVPIGFKDQVFLR